MPALKTGYIECHEYKWMNIDFELVGSHSSYIMQKILSSNSCAFTNENISLLKVGILFS